DDLAVELGKEALDEPAHPSVPDEQHAHHVVTVDRAPGAPTGGSAGKKHWWSAFMATGTSRSRMTNVRFRLDAGCETRRSGVFSSAVTARANTVGSATMCSPTAQTIAIPGSVATSEKARSSSTMEGSRFTLSTVTDTLTSDVVTTSTAVLWRSNTS